MLESAVTLAATLEAGEEQMLEQRSVLYLIPLLEEVSR